MQWEFIVALVVAIPVILFPVALVWYLNIGGISQAARQRSCSGKENGSSSKGNILEATQKDLRQGGMQNEFTRTKS